MVLKKNLKEDMERNKEMKIKYISKFEAIFNLCPINFKSRNIYGSSLSVWCIVMSYFTIETSLFAYLPSV